MSTTAVFESRNSNKHHDCKTDPACHHEAYFEAKIVPADGSARVSGTRTLCAVHLGEVVTELAEWARVHGITEGQVTVDIAAAPPTDDSLGSGSPVPGLAGGPFARIPLSSPAATRRG